MMTMLIASAFVCFQNNSMWYPDEYSLCTKIDVNGDGVRDVLVGLNGNVVTPDHVDVRGAGRVMALSGVDGSELWTARGDEEGDLFGWWIENVPDCNGDGVPELWVGAPGLRRRSVSAAAEAVRAGGIVLCSGKDGTRIRSLQWDSPCSDAGGMILRLDDIDGDGSDELGIGAANQMRIFVASSKTGAVLWTEKLDGWATGVQFSRIADRDHDGIADILLGVFSDDIVAGQYRGALRIRSGKMGHEIEAFTGSSILPEPWAFTGSLEPIETRDGTPWVLARCVLRPSESQGRVFLVSLNDRKARDLFSSPTASGEPLEGGDVNGSLGTSLTSFELRQGEPRADFAISAASWTRSWTGRPKGIVFLFSGTNGLVQTTLAPSRAENMCVCFGDRIAATGDVDRDGCPDLAVITWQREDCDEKSPKTLQVWSRGHHTILWTKDLAETDLPPALK